MVKEGQKFLVPRRRLWVGGMGPSLQLATPSLESTQFLPSVVPLPSSDQVAFISG